MMLWMSMLSMMGLAMSDFVPEGMEGAAGDVGAEDFGDVGDFGDLGDISF
jgi:hypothetical protein